MNRIWSQPLDREKSDDRCAWFYTGEGSKPGGGSYGRGYMCDRPLTEGSQYCKMHAYAAKHSIPWSKDPRNFPGAGS